MHEAPLEEAVDTVQPPATVIRLGSAEGEGEIALLCTEVMRRPYPSASFSVELQKRGFSGSHPNVCVDEASLAGFLGSLERLDRTRSGDAALTAMSPGELELRVRANGSCGHLIASASVGRSRYIGTNPVCVTDSAAIHFEVDPSALGSLLDAFREVSMRLKLDPSAATINEAQPSFLAPPADAAPYHGFPLVPETCTDGWCYGAITEFLEPEHHSEGCSSGGGFVQAPDGSRAGLVWWTECPEEIIEVYPPDADRWGVWEVRFSRPVRSLEDLVFNFRQVLPLLQARYREIREAND